MRLMTCVLATALFVLPLALRAEYIEITLPVDMECYRPCAPSSVQWESDIDPGEGAVIEVLWNTWQPPWNSLGISPNDGNQPWPDPPCWGEHSVIPIRHDVRVQYLTDPSVYDQVTFWTHEWYAEGPYTLFIDFDGDATSYGEGSNRIDPQSYTTVFAYVGVWIDEDAGPLEGLSRISVGFEVGPPDALVAPSFECLVPGATVTGGWDSGYTLSFSECLGSPGTLVYLGQITVFYLNGAGQLGFSDHPEYPREVLDCSVPPGGHSYIIGYGAGVGGAPPTPVELTSWGSIKAMYR